MSTLEKIHKYLKETLELTDDEITAFDSGSVYIAQEIALYAHRNQYRENGEKYVTHPFNCLDSYRKLVGIIPDDYFCIDTDLMAKHDIPFDGVQEVCVLHDVLEDTEFSMEEIEEVFLGLGLNTYFQLYIKKPLELITHNESVPYKDYISLVLENPISAIVKMMDMVDNLNVLGLAELNVKKLERTKDYLDYIKIINDKYHFIEKALSYKIDFNKERMEQVLEE